MASQYNLLHLHKFDFNTVMEATDVRNQGCRMGTWTWGSLRRPCSALIALAPCVSPCSHGTRKRSHEDGKEVQRTILVNAWFSKMKLTLPQAIRLIFAWCMRIPQTQAAPMAKVSGNTASNWYAVCRVLCSKELLEGEFKV
ncbi:unnamed protein product [Phytophthora fragariaefolia]|uniref:Unnamed protein product n=1 Tax=Phytophthora fragariaefolia TaxID=1490495 RepID=A0A9W6WSD4_9STRA|nr:unnamed protein product [Phytophthora fragariaefolia]